MKPTSSFWIGTVLVLSGCASPPEAVFDSAAKEEVRSAVEDRIQGYIQAVRDLNLDYMLDFFDNSEDFVFDDHGSPPIGYEEYAEVLREFAESGMTVTSEDMSPLQTVVLGPGAASCGFEYSWTMEDSEGNTVSAEGTWIYVMKNTDGVWRAVHSTGMHLYQ
jgi:uncharacterized protein (TIGR02246 family)